MIDLPENFLARILHNQVQVLEDIVNTENTKKKTTKKKKVAEIENISDKPKRKKTSKTS